MKTRIAILAILGAIIIGGCDPSPTATPKAEIPPPLRLSPPELVTLPVLNQTFSNQRIQVTEDIRGALFQNCTLEVWRGNGITITDSMFINSRMYIEESQNIEISNSVIRDFYVWEEPAINIHSSQHILIGHNEIKNNSIGVVISECSDTEIRNNIFESNNQHNALVLGGTSADVYGNVFLFNFPHAMLIMNRAADPTVQVNIYNNIFDRNIEDAINFEDFRGSDQISRVYNNRVTGTGWAGINVEYNSWNANLILEDNYIDSNGLMTDEIMDEGGQLISIYPPPGDQPEPYSPGWKHGIKIEDSSGVIVRGNVIVDNQGNGIDIKNSREITLEGNLVTRNVVGVSVMKYLESSLTRGFSPIAEENAGYSFVTSIDNLVFSNIEEDWFVEEGSRLIAGDK